MPLIPPHLSTGERLRRWGVSAWSLIGILILLAMSFWLLLKIRIIFPPLVLALLFIYFLNPPITWLETRGMPRAVAAVGTYVVVAGIIVGLGFLLYPFFSSQVEQFSEDWPAFRTEIVSFTEDTASSIEDRFGFEIDTSGVSCLLGDAQRAGSRNCDEVAATFREQLSGSTGQITRLGLTVLEALLVFILAPLIALYLLIDLPQRKRDLVNLFPERLRPEAVDLGQKLARAVGGFFRGQLFVASTVGVMSAAGFWIIGLKFWLVIGVIAGFFNLIPMVGPFIGGGLGFLVGAMTGGVGLGLKAALVELIVQQLDNHVISPQVMKRTVHIHPAMVVLALLAGGALAGFWGVLLAVPAVAVGKILLGHLWATRVLGEDVTPFTRRAHASRSEAPVVDPPEVDPPEVEPAPKEL
ncbi:MAG: AI-2E family transporter [Actinobacteria bacterium]|nr:AI-2E family transporter [Actinomycetota bacterium]